MNDIEKRGQGDLQMADILQLDESKANNLFRKRFVRYQKLAAELGDDAAYEAMLKHYPAQQKALMGAFIDDNSLAKGFQKAIPLLGLMGFKTEVVDVSQHNTDAALEIQRVCPFIGLAEEYGFDTPCTLFCEMEQEAARRAFPGLKAEILSKKAEGNCVCVFKYERAARTPLVTQCTAEKRNLANALGQFARLGPTIVRIGFRMLKMKLYKP
ncbi:L-2-amino-thiazoline-4-carboxylic acid hydrolase [cf. Phormidesmis sp. LEGE 11477]|uniref:L-2-amino-thiazoline-4-carboxylic acid hydrolase n=1 Tax=cf. Phormidesmis sp. LEGE 11477 TaxID=1828680 RepID=UPI00187F83DA|nr:L-2-amino-thiazoline-4-carboxylic acid hydrolase [cf. Phormidesmis sp. LEGE 11477]MBE9060626.1 L-2-amino-thiazoline-4-carboxylic acid hydrolase [cf. Phormidesmis sp. LEGE 11477]